MTITSDNIIKNDTGDLSTQLSKSGYCVLPNAFNPEALKEMRQIVIANRDEMPNTRVAPHSRHLAGFGRFLAFKQLYAMVDTNPALNLFLETHFGEEEYTSFGLSDITVNRSQHWHTDLLRSQYAHFLEHLNPWSADVGSCIKALVYLQEGKSLQVVPASHLAKTPLDDTLLEELAARKTVHHVPIAAGDIVMMDIRCLHRGSTEAAMAEPTLADDPKILISNVYAQSRSALKGAMKAGNDHRLQAWDKLHMGTKAARLNHA